jgi:hypothetical protein
VVSGALDVRRESFEETFAIVRDERSLSVDDLSNFGDFTSEG